MTTEGEFVPEIAPIAAREDDNAITVTDALPVLTIPDGQVPEKTGGDWGQPIYIPPYPYVLRQPVELVVRLRSTRSGCNASWSAGEDARHALNKARYEPVLRAIVTDFAWTPAVTRDQRVTLPEIACEGGLVRQRGSAVVNWQARVLQRLPDPLEDLFTAAWEYTQEHKPQAEQGALRVWLLDGKSPDMHPLYDRARAELPRAGSGARWLYNHLLYPVARYAYRVDGDSPHFERAYVREWPIAYALAVPGRDGATIVSAQHPDQAVRACDGQLILAAHPLPQQAGVD
jgi:hypothetical protein